MKILVIQTAFLGDLILTLPLIQTLKANIPDAEIDVLCIPYTQSILNNNPYIKNVIVFDKHHKRKISDLRLLAVKLQANKYNYAIIPHRSIRSGMIAMMAQIENRIGFRKPFFDWLYTETTEYPVGIHEVDRNLCLLKSFGFTNYSRLPELFPSKVDVYSIDNILTSNHIGKKFACIAPGSKWFTKKWLSEYFKILCHKLISSGIPVVLIGGNEDVDVCNFITVGTNHIINTCGQLSLHETTALIKRSSLLISNDSAPVHLASAVNTPVIDIYGPTVPGIGFYPLSDKSVSLQIDELNCRPCGIHGGRKCPVKSFNCMKDISPDLVYKTAMSIIDEQNI